MGFARNVIKTNPSGIIYDLAPDDVPQDVFTAGRNFNFRDNAASRVLGYSRVYGDAIFPPQYLLNSPTELENFWLYCSSDSVAVMNGTAHFDITPASPITPAPGFNNWTGGLLNGIPCINTPLSDPLYWDLQTANPCQTLPGWPAGTKAQLLRPCKYHLVAMGITDAGGDFGEGVMWSDAADPGQVPTSWTPAPSNQAGSAYLSASPGVIIDASQLRDGLAIYKNNSTYLMQYVGGNDVYSFRKVLDTVGALARNCSIEFAGMNLVLTDSDVVLFDGITSTSVIDAKNRKWLFQQIDPDNFHNSFVCRNWISGELWVCFPSVGNITPNLALVLTIASGEWGIREIPNPAYITDGIVAPSTGTVTWNSITFDWDDVPGIWDQSTYVVASASLMMADDTNSLFYNVDAENTNDGTNVEAWLQRIGLDMGSPQERKLLKRIWPRLQGVAGTVVMIRAGAHECPTDAVLWSDPVPFTIGTDSKVDTFANGRYLAYEISSDTLQPYRLTGVDLEFTMTGAW